MTKHCFTHFSFYLLFAVLTFFTPLPPLLFALPSASGGAQKKSKSCLNIINYEVVMG